MSNHDNGTNVLVRYYEHGRSTVKARQFFVSETDTEGVWIPRSQIAYLDTDTRELWIPLWLARNNGLDYE